MNAELAPGGRRPLHQATRLEPPVRLNSQLYTVLGLFKTAPGSSAVL